MTVHDHDKKYALELLEELPEREKRIVKMRFGIDTPGSKNMKLQEIATELNINSEQYVQILFKKAIEKLKELHNEQNS